MSRTTAPPPTSSRRTTTTGPVRRRSATSYAALGEPMIWLSGGALCISLAMIVGLLSLILYRGLITFWPEPVVRLQTFDGQILLGEPTVTEQYRPTRAALEALPPDRRDIAEREMQTSGGFLRRSRIRTESEAESTDSQVFTQHFRWMDLVSVKQRTYPQWAFVVERAHGTRLYGFPKALNRHGQQIAATESEIWNALSKASGATRLDAAAIESGDAPAKSDAAADANRQSAATGEAIPANGSELVVATAAGNELAVPLSDIVRVYPANRLSWTGRTKVYLARSWEFISADPRQANSQGGVFPAIFGTVTMTLLMSVAVVPFGVLAALYLREYAKAGVVISAVRVAVNNLAGVPSIVFGVFGLGFFCYILGGSVDQLFFSNDLPNPTFGKGGLLWASLTLALLTLPVVIVASEEALSAVPNSMREGSYACGASKWQTIYRIVLPRAMPGMMTGLILAMARGAGEVAPLMFVGAVKLAPDLPIDGQFPYLHPQRAFMHLGMHIYDLAFQNPNSEAAEPMVFTTALLLVFVVAALNASAVMVRARLRRRFQLSQF